MDLSLKIAVEYADKLTQEDFINKYFKMFCMKIQKFFGFNNNIITLFIFVSALMLVFFMDIQMFHKTLFQIKKSYEGSSLK